MSHINLFLTLSEDSLAVLTVREERFTVKSPESHLAQSYDAQTGLSLRAGGRGFPPATMSVVPGYFYWKIEEK